MLSEKEKLEEELKLLKESFELDVITKEEYGNAKQRIEARLKRLERESEEKLEIEGEGIKEKLGEEEKPEIKEDSIVRHEAIEKEEGEKEEPFEEEVKDEAREEELREGESVKREEKEQKEEDTISINFSWLKNIFRKKEPVEEKPEDEKAAKEKILEQKTLEEIQEAEERPKEEAKVEEEKPAEEVKKEKEEAKVLEEKPEEIEEEKEKAEEEKPEIKEEEVIEKEPVEEEVKISKKVVAYVAIILILVIGLWYLFFLEPSSDVSVDVPTGEAISLIACNSDNDCIKEGSIGTCLNPGQENAECEYIKDIKIKLTIINSNDCFNCDSQRVLSILNGFFPNIDIENIDIETEQGKEIAEKFGVNALPAYMFNSSFKEAYNYDKLSSSFNEVNGFFVMKNTVANANYYLDREKIPNKLDLFLKQDQTASSKAEENLKEFLEAFDGNVNFEKHNEDSGIVKELGINTFPAFLINNKIKFSGVQSADKIKENFCQVNELDECELVLSKSLV